MPTDSLNTSRNVIAFPPKGQRSRVAISCDVAQPVRSCVHCGGWLADDESEDECSSALVQKRLSIPSQNWYGLRSRSSNA